ncbi:MAG: HAMP domain-containing sensor histidine kinase [Oscillospiraceae bacterium]|nr:HAMP domain-containing sensor histidine kinase [Oscillospiraceae bacterium]
MSIWDYIATKTVSLCLAAMAGLYLSMVCYFCGIPVSLIGILLLSGMIVLLLCFIIGWRRTDRRLRMLRSRLDDLSEKYLIGETLERPRDAVELEYYLLMKEISRSAIGAVEQARTEKQDYCDYVESWVHEIKTPLTASSLILTNGADPTKLRRELRRADNLTENILTYAKLRTAEKDTQITLTDLRAVCDEAIREEMELLIAANISVSVDGEAAVYTDSKLLVSMIKQLLINCTKYCCGCQIQIALEMECLIFEDNGSGIPAHELNRVTERGFTGSAGRKYGGSTGMGLYIVSELCKKLNIGLEIVSEQQHFTRFTFRFPPVI